MTEAIKRFFRKKKEDKHLINAIIKAERKWGNNMDYGNVMRTFVHRVKEKNNFDEDTLHDMLSEISATSASCKL